MKFEPVTRKQVTALIKSAGMGAMVIDWKDIDYDLGRGMKDEKNWKAGHCLFNLDGRRIDIGGYGVGLIISQTKEPDPMYQKYKRKKKRKIIERKV